MLEELELGELEKRYSPFQLGRISEYLIALAQEGILPGEYDEEMALGKEIIIGAAIAVVVAVAVAVAVSSSAVVGSGAASASAGGAGGGRLHAKKIGI